MIKFRDFNVLFLAILLALLSTIGAEESVKSSQDVDEPKIIDRGGLEPPKSNVLDSDDLTEEKVAENFKNALLPGPQILTGPVLDTFVNDNKVDPNIVSDLKEDLSDNAEEVKETAETQEPEKETDLTEIQKPEQKTEIQEPELETEIQETEIQETEPQDIADEIKEETEQAVNTDEENLADDDKKNADSNAENSKIAEHANSTSKAETKPEEVIPESSDDGHVDLSVKDNGMMTGNENWDLLDKPQEESEKTESTDNKEKTVDDGHVDLSEKSNGMMTGNENWDILENKVDNAPQKQDTVTEDNSVRESVDDVYVNLDDKDAGIETGNDADEDETTTSTVTTTFSTSTVTEGWWNDDDSNDYDYETEDDENDDYDEDDSDDDDDDDEDIWADKKADYKNQLDDDDNDVVDVNSENDDDYEYDDTTTDDDDSSWEQWWNDDDDDDDDDYDVWGSTTTTTESWESTANYDDDDDDSYEWNEVDAGKNMMESPHHFDNNAGVFAGAKVANEHGPMKTVDSSMYKWTLLLSLCIVVGLFFVYWNRQKFERYLVSFRHGTVVRGGHVVRIGDEEKNLLKHEYA